VLVREHYKPIAGNLGFLMQFAGILMIAPALLATLLGENKSATGIYLAVVSMSISGFLLNTYGEKSPLNLKQSSIVVVSGFVLLSVFGSLPYMYLNPFWGNIDFATLFINSFFESSSGFTTTGISTITHPEDLPNSFTFYRSYTLWVGGLSFVYLIMSLYYPEKKLVAMKNILGAGILRFKQLASTISVIFTFYAVILTLLVYFLGDGNNGIANVQLGKIIDSTSVVFATLTSGGFVPVSTFLTLESVGQLLVVMAGMVLAALPFAFHYGIFSREIKARKLGSEVVVYGVFITLAIVVFTLIEYPFLYSAVSAGNATMSGDLSQMEKEPANVWILSAFHVISASTTTGFQFIDLSHLSVGGKVVLIVIMLIGGTAFSTAGGIKIARLIIIFKSLRKRKPSSLANTSTSISSIPSQFGKEKDFANENVGKKNDRGETKGSRKTTTPPPKPLSSMTYLESAPTPVPNKPFREALFVMALFIAVSFASALTIGFLDNRGFIDALFESASTISNTGLSVGIATMDLDDISKLVLSMNMILGRFEIIAVLYIFVDALRR
jgi:trk system potassium uptake protein TrkH